MKKIVLSALLLATTVAFAQESKVSVSGTVDMYGTANFVDGAGTPGILIARSSKCKWIWIGIHQYCFRLRR